MKTEILKRWTIVLNHHRV